MLGARAQGPQRTLASRASPALTLRTLGRALRTTCRLGVTILMPALAARSVPSGLRNSRLFSLCCPVSRSCEKPSAASLKNARFRQSHREKCFPFIHHSFFQERHLVVHSVQLRVLFGLKTELQQVWSFLLAWPTSASARWVHVAYSKFALVSLLFGPTEHFGLTRRLCFMFLSTIRFQCFCFGICRFRHRLRYASNSQLFHVRHCFRARR